MSILNGLYLLDGGLIECQWQLAENDKGEVVEVFSTNLSDDKQFGLCKTLIEQMDPTVDYQQRIQQAIQLFRNRASWQAVPELAPEGLRTLH